MANIYALTDTWNDAGTTFDAIKMTITDTASNTDSNFISFYAGATLKFRVRKLGYVYLSEQLIMMSGAGATLGRMIINSDGVFQLSNAAISDFGRLQFGGSTSSFPALKRNGATLEVKLADDSNFSGLNTGTHRVEAGSAFSWNGRARLASSADGIIELFNAASSDFTRLNFGGSTSSFPALRRSGTTLAAVLADNSNLASFDAFRLAIQDGISAPGATVGLAKIYVDTADGDLKVVFGDGIVKTLATDT